MAKPKNVNKNKLTNLSTLPLVFHKTFSTPGEIIGWMVDDVIRSANRQFSPRAYVSSRLGVDESELSLMINNRRPIKITHFCIVASIAKTPEAFQYLKEYALLGMESEI